MSSTVLKYANNYALVPATCCLYFGIFDISRCPESLTFKFRDSTLCAIFSVTQLKSVFRVERRDKELKIVSVVT